RARVLVKIVGVYSKPYVIAAVLDKPNNPGKQIEPENACAKGLEKYHGPEAVPLDDVELVAQPALAKFGDAVKIAVRCKTSAITLPVGSVRGNFGIDGYDDRHPLRDRRQPSGSAAPVG